MSHTAFYISDGTAITAEVIGHATLSQYPIEIEHITSPFIETEAQALHLCDQINIRYKTTGNRPFVFFTFVEKAFKRLIKQTDSICFDVLSPFTKEITQVLNIEPTPKLHRTHSIHEESYDHRIGAMNYALANDDGQTTQHYDDADVILVGVSRSGKTPTSLYLALQYGIKAANYPFIEDDMDDLKLSNDLKQNKKKIFGLTIEPARLAAIRHERYANSKYASIRQCRMELREVERMYKKNKIPYINTTHFSVEEISAKVISEMGLERHKY
ncbi:pyruvate, water dikinase regulatory protein [Psychrosphaera aquimarina]|uniref:Putative phosphoenolpyruvate synthase regulatory protein n=1 Tax=Psychrosphaera aquimarina TaxID=2044854 RepID=A0ABU3QW42_9GAMM|nr:pyruvate, water dikinase regulatory protein [Psychrosphaera aquimarina]MDU0111662.1 pyruvate, water dikinase regulatory protein [Psychrosphaera aquimarina]